VTTKVTRAIETKPVVRVVPLVALAVILLLPAQAAGRDDCAAAGSDPTAAQYCTQYETEEVAESGSGSIGSSANGELASASAGGGSLPFTGTDLLALGAVAAAFMAISLALRRLSTARPGAD